ncbi:MAG TPA: hypothetical protein VEB22_01310 [Phycisphaerales bacterium]|nr:hypothetical protein [Phycisphaerales bacterium]
MFALDIDLLVLEPNLFADAGWSAQRLTSAVATLSGTTLTLAGADLVAASVDAGCVALLNGVPLEVVARTGAGTLTVSLVRWGRTGPAIPPVGLSGGGCEVYTFRPQIAMVHRHILRLLGLGEGEEAAVTNAPEFTTYEALLALHAVYSSAGAAAPAGSPLADRATQFRLRAAAERTRLAALVDTDGDGLADATRRPAVIPLLRG